MTTPPASSTRWASPIVVGHATVFVVGVIVSILDLRGQQFIGAPLARVLAVPLAAIVIGACREARGGPAPRAILIAADVAIATGAIVQILFPFPRGAGLASSWPAAALLLVTVTGLLIAIGAKRTSATGVSRSVVHRVLLLLLVTFAIVTPVAQFAPFGGPRVSLDNIVPIVAVSLASDLVVIALWWWGSPWLLGIVGAVGIVTFVEVVAATGRPLGFDNILLYGVLSLVAIVVRPREIAPASESRAGGRSNGPPRASVVWLLIGSALFVPAVFIGLFPPILVDCFDQCPKDLPGADTLIAIDMLMLVVVPLAAVAVAVAPTRGYVFRRFGPVIALVGAGFVLVQVGLGLAGVSPFTWLPAAAPAATLLALGAGAAILRPTWLDGTGRVAALAAGIVVVVWTWSGISLGPLDLPFAKATAIIAGAIVGLVVARESHAGTREPDAER